MFELVRLTRVDFTIDVMYNHYSDEFDHVSMHVTNNILKVLARVILYCQCYMLIANLA